MKCISRLTSTLKNSKGLSYVHTLIFVIIIITIAMVIVVIINTQLQAMEIKKTVRMETNNLSAIITADTYNATKRGSLVEYNDRLHTSLQYKDYLLDTTTDNIASNLGLTKSGATFTRINEKGYPDFSLSDFSLSQHNDADRIRYTVDFTITFHLRFAAKPMLITQPVTYETHHVKNY